MGFYRLLTARFKAQNQPAANPPLALAAESPNNCLGVRPDLTVNSPMDRPILL
jgi:hypothetical protein